MCDMPDVDMGQILSTVECREKAYLHQHFSRRLCSRVRICRLKSCMLPASLARAMTGFAVYFVRTHMNEAFDKAIQARGFQQTMSSVHVVLRERKAVAEAVVNVRLLT